MKFLLTAINARYIHSNPAVYSLRASVGKRYIQQVEIVEYTINQYMEEILADIYGRQPDVIGFSCYIWNRNLVEELLRELPKVLPGVPVWLGGPEVTYDAEGILKTYPAVTGIMTGEGEAAFRELIAYYASKPDIRGVLRDIPGLYLSTGPTPPREMVDLNELPFFYETRDQNLEHFANRIIYYESSRGCPYRCSYCLSSIEKKVRLRDTDVVKRELQFFLDRKVAQVKFVDRTFNCDHRHAMAIWQYILEHDNGVTNFHFEIAANILREEEIALLGRMRPGLVQLEIGVQTVNPLTLEAIHRTMDVEQLEGIVSAIRRRRNIHQHLDLIAGLPYEDYDSFGSSFDRVYAMKPDQLQLGFLKVLKGSEMYDRAEEFGICFRDRPPYEVLSTRWLTYGEILRLKRIEAVTELYYNSGQFTHTMEFLKSAFSSPFAMYEALADFYKRGGYERNNPSRTARYQILLDFAGEYDGRRTAIYRELLTFDMYLRENMKSRPPFAPDLSFCQETVREFYRREEERREYLPAYPDYDWKQLRRMTHLEPFCYPVWDVDSMTGMAEREAAYILFDYGYKDPVTKEARTVLLDRESWQP